MDINQILQTLDHLFATKQLHKVENYLISELAKALSTENHSVAITLMNELIGYYRSVSRHQDAILITQKTMGILHHLGLEDTISYATTLLNGATAYRAASHLDEAQQMYEEVICIYNKLLSPTDYRFASLYNNISLLYSERKQFDQAISYLLQALPILQSLAVDSMEEAVTHTNLSLLYLELGDDTKSENHIEEALRIFHSNKASNDPHYCGALSSLAQLYYKKKNYTEAMSYYAQALSEIKENFGENSSYALVCENYASVCETIGDIDMANRLRETAHSVYVRLGMQEREPLSGLELARKYYEAYGKPMLLSKFPNYIDRIAVGLVGPGSECFGFDDSLSTDHDFGPSFCLWLTDEDYEKMGTELQAAYDNLPASFAGYSPRNITSRGVGRVGVLRISSFYESILGLTPEEIDGKQWCHLPEHLLATATNGEVFQDGLGIFSSIRSSLNAYYPQTIWLQKLATEAANMAQAGQYNYPRCMKRGDTVAASFALQEFIRATIAMAHLLNKTYTPYYKWMFTSLKCLPILSELAPQLQTLSELGCHEAEQKITIIEQICAQVILELQKQGISNETSDFLEDHVETILSHIE